MRIIARSRIIEYYTLHPDTRTALEDWFQKVRQADGIVLQILNKCLTLQTASAISVMCSIFEGITTD